MVNLRQFLRFIPSSYRHSIGASASEDDLPLPDSAVSEGRHALLGALGLSGLSLLSLMVLYAALHHDTSHMTSMANLQNNRTQTILKELNDMHSEFQQLENNPQSSANLKAALSDMNNHLDKIQTGLTSMQSDMDNKITDLQQAVNNNPNTRAYIDAKNLPFQVIAIDVIAQQPFVSVNYDHHVSPLGIGDSLSGWNLMSADYDQSTAVFKNDRDQYVQVALKN